MWQLHGKNYDQRITEARLRKKRLLRLKAEGERARFEAKHEGEKPKVYCNFGISDLDPFTHQMFTWDYWLKFPFKILKDEDKFKRFNEAIQDAFENIFLA